MRLKRTIILGRPDDPQDTSTSTLLHSSNFWIILGYSLLYVTAYQYCNLYYNRDPTSFFFDPRKGYRKAYSLQREQQAETFIKAINSSISAPRVQADPSICLGLATVARPGEQYVRKTIGSLLAGLSDDQRDNIHLTVFFADTHPQNHPVYNEPWLKNTADKIVEYNVSAVDIARLRSFEEKHQYWNKSMYDYEYLLKDCHDTGTKWVMLVEDDVLAKAGWFAEAIAALTEIEAQMGGSKWLYLRLFYTEKLFGWNSEEWMQYLGWSIIAFLVTAITLFGIRAYSRRLRKHMSNYTIALICFFCLPATIVLYFMAGRVSMHPPSPGLQRMEKFGCCSQGLIFPHDIVPQAIETVRHATNKRYYVDMTLERWGNADHLARFALVPPLLQHVGSQSSKGHDFDEGANSIWNFEFENYT